MERRRLTSVAVALLVAVVVGVAAATLGRTRSSSSQMGSGDGSSGLPLAGASSGHEGVTPVPDLLWLLAAFLVAVAILFLVGAVLFPRKTLRQTLLGAAMGGVIVGAWWLLLQFVDERPTREDSDGAPQAGEGDGLPFGLGDGTGEPGGAVLDPGVLMMLLVGLVGLGVLGVVLSRSRSADDPRSSEGDGSVLSAIGHSAGQAADRIAETDAALDNEVYRAWKEMTDHLDLEDPVTRTPEEFRATARSVGMIAADVDALTDLFRDVRYGGARPTDGREAAAIDALRRIEERYADDGEPLDEGRSHGTGKRPNVGGSR